MRINSVPDVKCFCNNKNVLRAQSMVWHFVRHSVDTSLASFVLLTRGHLEMSVYLFKRDTKGI